MGGLDQLKVHKSGLFLFFLQPIQKKKLIGFVEINILKKYDYFYTKNLLLCACARYADVEDARNPEESDKNRHDAYFCIAQSNATRELCMGKIEVVTSVLPSILKTGSGSSEMRLFFFIGFSYSTDCSVIMVQKSCYNYPMPVKSFFKQIKTLILDILFPIECLGCGQENIWLCDECLAKIPINQVNKCVVCKKVSEDGSTHQGCQSQTYLDGVIIACPWESKLLQDAIHKYKYNFIQNLSYPLSQLLIKKLKDCDIIRIYSSSNSHITPIPLHKKRLRWRGFNQAELLANKVADYLNLTTDNSILIRKRYTTPQMSLNRKKRLDNLQSAFHLTEYGQNIIKQGINNFILIDDVLTTGATMNECAQVLKNSGAKKVWGLVLARG